MRTGAVKGQKFISHGVVNDDAVIVEACREISPVVGGGVNKGITGFNGKIQKLRIGEVNVEIDGNIRDRVKVILFTA